MVRTIVYLTLAAVLTSHLGAQTHPDLSGHWKFLAPPAPSAPAPPKNPGAPALPPAPPATLALTITQTAGALTIERIVEGAAGPQKLTYKLDGGEAVNEIGGYTYRTKAEWKDGGLVLSSNVTAKGKPAGVTIEVYRLQNGDLFVETTRQGPGGGQVSVSKASFRKGA